MSQWHVELICKKPQLLSFLSTTLQEPLCTVKAESTDCYYLNPGTEPRLAARKTSGYFLLSSEFSSLSDAVDVRNCAKAMLPFLNALVKLKISVYTTPIDIEDVFRPDAQGRLLWEIATVTATFSSLESRLQKAAGQPLNFTEIWHLAQKYPAIEEALHQLANETNWFNLYKVHEIIELDVGKKTLNTWSNRNEDFTYSANNAHASHYDARHSLRHKPSAKRTPMSLSEGGDFVIGLFLQWLQAK